jgi:hypothetical protein
MKEQEEMYTVALYVGFNELRIENILEKNWIYSEHVKTFFLSLFPEQYSKTTIYIAFYILLSIIRHLKMI